MVVVCVFGQNVSNRYSDDLGRWLVKVVTDLIGRLLFELSERWGYSHPLNWLLVLSLWSLLSSRCEHSKDWGRSRTFFHCLNLLQILLLLLINSRDRGATIAGANIFMLPHIIAVQLRLRADKGQKLGTWAIRFGHVLSRIGIKGVLDLESVHLQRFVAILVLNTIVTNNSAL